MAAPKTETETAFVFSCAGPVAAHDAARKVIPIVSPDVMEHSLKVHLAPLRPRTADPRRPVVIREHTPATTRSANQGAA